MFNIALFDVPLGIFNRTTAEQGLNCWQISLSLSSYTPHVIPCYNEINLGFFNLWPIFGNTVTCKSEVQLYIPDMYMCICKNLWTFFYKDLAMLKPQDIPLRKQSSCQDWSDRPTLGCQPPELNQKDAFVGWKIPSFLPVRNQLLIWP